MSKTHLSINNKNPKVYFKQYLANINEPEDYIFDGGMRPEFVDEILVGGYHMKNRIRKLAKRMRVNNHYNGLG